MMHIRNHVCTDITRLIVKSQKVVMAKLSDFILAKISSLFKMVNWNVFRLIKHAQVHDGNLILECCSATSPEGRFDFYPG